MVPGLIDPSSFMNHGWTSSSTWACPVTSADAESHPVRWLQHSS